MWQHWASIHRREEEITVYCQDTAHKKTSGCVQEACKKHEETCGGFSSEAKADRSYKANCFHTEA